MTRPICRELRVLSLKAHSAPDAPGGQLFTLLLESPGWESWLPGQFVMLRPGNANGDVFWARPFSICRADSSELRIVFQVAGRGTDLLRQVRSGDVLDVWGPLGNGFSVSEKGPTLLLAGGIGIAPFVGYIERHPAPRTLHLDFGHRLSLACYPFADCAAIDACSYLERGPDDLVFFLGVLEDGIRDMAVRGGLALACGPMPFLRSVQRFAVAHKARVQLSLETRMACGVGVCLGCVVKAAPPGGEHSDADEAPAPEQFRHIQTCTCGPVFWTSQIVLSNA
jgi:dihydroorotate dehydrogenase electron transfer subunit